MLQEKRTINLSESLWVDSFQIHALVINKSLPEIIQWCEKISDEEDVIIKY